MSLVALVVRVTLTAVLASSPALGASLAPRDPEMVFRLATLEYAQAGHLSTATRQRVAKAAATMPLSAEPFVLAATTAIAAGDSQRATRLLEEAQHRNPRQRLVRALLLERYIRANRLTEAGIELATLNRLVPDAGKLLGTAMTSMAMDPKTTGALEAAVRGDPSLDTLLANLVAKGADPALILRFARGHRPTPGAGTAPWEAALLARLVDEGRFAAARALWQSFSGVDRAAATRDLVYNAGFARSPALPPFNWRLASGEVGVAEFASGGRMAIDYYGRRSGELAAQLLTLPPGRYRLGFAASGRAEESGSRLTWTVRCADAARPAGGGQALLQLPLGNLSARSRRMMAGFTVPSANCAGQWLTLEAEAGEFPAAQSAEISGLALRAAGEAG